MLVKSIVFISLIILVILWEKYGKKDFFYKRTGFDDLLGMLTANFLIILYILVILPPLYKIPVFLLILRTRLRISLIVAIIFVYLFNGDPQKFFRMIGHYIFGIELNTKHNLQFLPKFPTIIIANYPNNYLEYTVQAMFKRPMLLLISEVTARQIKYLTGKNYLILVNTKNDYKRIMKTIQEKLDQNYTIFCYIERRIDTRKDPYKITEMRTGIFNIAKEIGAPITPVAIDHIDHMYGIIDNSQFNIRVGPTQIVNDPNKTMKQTFKFLQKNLRKFKVKQYT